ncbi:MAG: hypothetical protein ABWZ98_10835 [Nakamurella sp.]
MRTTVNIDEQLLAEARNRAARSHQSLGDVIDEVALSVRHHGSPARAGAIADVR